MANPEHLAKLKEGVEAWNQWCREKARDWTAIDVERPDLSGSNLSGMSLMGANLYDADLRGASLSSARLMKANLERANLSRADLSNTDLAGAQIGWANLQGANLCKARLLGSDLSGSDLREANLTRAILMYAQLDRALLDKAILRSTVLVGANLLMATLRSADLRRADLHSANLQSTNFSNSDLREANLSLTNLVYTNFEGSNLSGCRVFGTSVWEVRLKETIQSNLMANPAYGSTIQVDNLEMAQFIYLLLNNDRIRQAIDTITSKVVLILGRFTRERTGVLDALRDELRKRDYLPVLFDFEKPDNKHLTGTVTTLANMARFIITDLTDPSRVPHELATIIPTTLVPVQTILLEGQREYAMFADLRRRYHWVLEPYTYENEAALIGHIDEVLAPAEAKVHELRQKS